MTETSMNKAEIIETVTLDDIDNKVLKCPKSERITLEELIMNAKRIEVGDTVSVYFTHSNMVSGIVDDVPVTPGVNSWVILKDQGRIPVYVHTFEYMVLMSKGGE